MTQKMANKTEVSKEDLAKINQLMGDLRDTRLRIKGPLNSVDVHMENGMLAAKVVRSSGPNQEEKALLDIHPSEDGKFMEVDVLSRKDFHINRIMRFIPGTPWFYNAEELKISSEISLGTKVRVRISPQRAVPMKTS